MKADDDRTLVTAILAAGDEAAFRTLFRRHSPSLCALARRLLGGAPADADDAVQETWIRTSRKLASFRWDSTFRTWVSGILVNRCRELRRETRPSFEPPGDDQPALAASNETLRVDLERAIAGLPDGYRTVVVLHDVEGYTHEDIARFLDIDAGTSKSQLSRARRALRAALQEETKHDAR
jgi:RNA polymerase sigma-70 factor (ECF subfamily)